MQQLWQAEMARKAAPSYPIDQSTSNQLIAITTGAAFAGVRL